jgi:hypothetical protein
MKVEKRRIRIMKNNIVDLPNQKKSTWMPKNLDDLISKALEVVECQPIIKRATGIGKKWSYDKKAVYLDENGEVLKGYCAFQDVLIKEHGVDGALFVFKEVFITSNGEPMVFITTEQSEIKHKNGNRELFYKMNRFYSLNQTLSNYETEEFIWDLMFEINSANEC